MMKVGISTATFFSKVLTEDSFSVIQRCGGECAEVFLTTRYEYEPSFGDLLAERRGGLDIYSVHALNTQFEPELFNAVQRTRRDAEELYRKVLDVGRRMGARFYTFHGRMRLKRNMVISPEAAGRRMRELGDIAQEYGITLCFENVHWAMFNSPEFFAEAKEYCPNVGAVLDIKQARQSGRDWREYVAVMGNRLMNVHVSDCDDTGAIKLVGRGTFPFDELVRTLDGVGYGGPLMIEQYADNYGDVAEVADAVTYLKHIVGGIYA